MVDEDPAQTASKKYERIADILRALISSGELREGDRLPGENDLMKEYGVARMTARQALAALANEGLTEARKGAGVFVRTFQPVRRFGNRRLSRSTWGEGRSIWDADTSDPVEIDGLVVGEEPAGEQVAKLLDVQPGATLVVRRRRYLVARRPVQLATSYVPADLAIGTRIAEADTGCGGVYARLADSGHAPVRFVEEMRARMPSAHEAGVLRLSVGTPVIVVVRTAFEAGGRPVEASEMTLSAAAYVLQYEFEA